MVPVKVDKNKVTKLANVQVIHSIKVDYKKLEELDIFQIPEREPDPIRITNELMKYLEQLPFPEQNGIKVDYKQ